MRDFSLNIQGDFAGLKRLLRVGGLSMEEKEPKLYKLYSYVIWVALVTFVAVSSSDIVKYSSDTEVNFAMLSINICVSLIILKAWVVNYNKDKFKETLKILQKETIPLDLEKLSKEEKNSIYKPSIVANKQMTITFIMDAMGFTVPVLNCIFKRILAEGDQKWDLPYANFFILHVKQSPNFELALAFQGFTVFVGSAIYAGADFFAATVFARICVKLRLLQHLIRSIKTDVEEDEKRQLPLSASRRHLKEKFNQCVRYHNSVLGLAVQFEDILNMLVLTNYLGVMLYVSFVMYDASLYSLGNPRFREDICEAGGVIFQLSIISYWGNEVTIESQNISKACYEVIFTMDDLQLQKDMCMVMRRSQREMYFTIGKFAKLSITSLFSILKAGFSYYMVLRNMKVQK